jgi:antitoxin PrlF
VQFSGALFDTPVASVIAVVVFYADLRRRRSSAKGARRLAAPSPMPYNDPESKENPLAESAVTSKGQITIPAEVRRAMGLQHQDRVVFTVMPDGTTVMRAKTRSLHTLAGVLKGRGKKLSVKKMRIGR